MRLLDLFKRRGASPRSAPEERTSPDGLDAFAPEHSTPGPVSRKRPEAGGGSRLVPVALGLLVVAQAVPTFLWLQERLTSPAAAAADDLPASRVAFTAPVPPCEGGGEVERPVPDPPSPVGTTLPATVPRRQPAPALSAGMVAVSAPVPMHVYSRGRLVGTTEAETIMLPVGTHDLEFVSEAAGYRTSRRVSIQAARTTDVRLEAPAGILHVNALPWAEVWLDNRRIGETPIGNFKAPIGRREVLFRHPELGERRETVLVTLKEPARVSADLRPR